MKYCDTPVIVTYVPEGVSTNWEEDWIMHDSHGGRMFEASQTAKNNINPDSLKPPKTVSNSGYKSEYKSMEPKTPDYHDSPEYRKSLHLQGREKEEILQKLRARLGLSGKVGAISKDVKTHTGVDTSLTDMVSSVAAGSEESMEISAPAAQPDAYAPPPPPPPPPPAPSSYAPPPAESTPMPTPTGLPPPTETEAPPTLSHLPPVYPEQPKYEEPPPPPPAAEKY